MIEASPFLLRLPLVAERRLKLESARRQNRGRHEPRRTVGGIDRQDRTVVGNVIEPDARIQSNARRQLEILRDTQVELMLPGFELGVWRNQWHGRRGGTHALRAARR